MANIIRRFFVTALVGFVFLVVFILFIETTILIPDQHQETAYFVFLTPWLVWGFFYFTVPLFVYFVRQIRNGL